MAKEFLTIKEASELTGKSINTIKRFVENYKNKSFEDFKEYQTKNKSISYRIKRQFLSIHYTINSDTMDSINSTVNDTINNSHRQENNTVSSDTTDSINDTINDTMREKKEAMQIAYSSEIIKQKNDTINRLIEGQKKPFIRLPVFWSSIAFLILIISILFSAWLYRKEIISTYNSKINEVTSFKNEIIKSKENSLKDTKNELQETRTAYQHTLKAVDLLHVKYNNKLDNKRKLLSIKEKHYLTIIKEDKDKIKQLEEKIKELSASQSLSDAQRSGE